MTITTRTRRRDPDTRSMRGRGYSGEQAATRSRDPSAPAVRRSVAKLGFEFMVCRSKNVYYNLVNAFYQLGNNCNINVIWYICSSLWNEAKHAFAAHMRLDNQVCNICVRMVFFLYKCI
jgi:hypothetical protein